MSGEPKPCPFCGAGLSEPLPVRGSSVLFRFHPGVVTDDDCIMSGKGFGDWEIDRWNTRAPATLQVAQPPELRERVLDVVERALFAKAAPSITHMWDEQRARAMEFEAQYPGYLEGHGLITDVIRDAATVTDALITAALIAPSAIDGREIVERCAVQAGRSILELARELSMPPEARETPGQWERRVRVAAIRALSPSSDT